MIIYNVISHYWHTDYDDYSHGQSYDDINIVKQFTNPEQALEHVKEIREKEKDIKPMYNYTIEVTEIE